MAKTNPFFDVDMSKFADVSKLMSEFKLPGVDVESVLASQQKNIQALTAANQLAIEGFQAVVRRQSEIVRQTMEQTSSMVTELMAAGSPEDKVAKQADLVKLAFEKALSNARELAELVAKSNSEAAEVINKRVSESLEEVKAVVAKVKCQVSPRFIPPVGILPGRAAAGKPPAALSFAHPVSSVGPSIGGRHQWRAWKIRRRPTSPSRNS